MTEIKRRMKCPYCGYECETRGIGKMYCGPHADSAFPAVPMREIDSPEQGESKGSAQALPNIQSGPERSLGQIAFEKLYSSMSLNVVAASWEDFHETHKHWEASAQAVQNAAIDQCMEILRQLEHEAERNENTAPDEKGSIMWTGAILAIQRIGSEIQALKKGTDNDNA